MEDRIYGCLFAFTYGEAPNNKESFADLCKKIKERFDLIRRTTWHEGPLKEFESEVFELCGVRRSRYVQPSVPLKRAANMLYQMLSASYGEPPVSK